MALPPWLSSTAAGVTVSLKVQPRASSEAFGPVLGAQLKLKVTAPPVDSAANEAVIKAIAHRLGCSKASVELIRGQTSRNKWVRIHGMAAEEVAAKLLV